MVNLSQHETFFKQLSGLVVMIPVMILVCCTKVLGSIPGQRTKESDFNPQKFSCLLIAGDTKLETFTKFT